MKQDVDLRTMLAALLDGREREKAKGRWDMWKCDPMDTKTKSSGQKGKLSD